MTLPQSPCVPVIFRRSQLCSGSALSMSLPFEGQVSPLSTSA